MPSASTKPDTKTSSEVTDPFKNAITVVEKKVRNLEKRKGKLDTIRAKQDEGEELNQDQKEAVSKYEGVLQNLEFAKELHKQFMSISAEADKNQKKVQRRERVERQKHDIKQIREVLKLQNILDGMGSDEVRNNFKKGENGAPVLSDEELTQLDELYKVISPSREENTDSFDDQLQSASDHLVSFIEGKEKAVVGTTYKALKEMVDKIQDSGYFDQVSDSNEDDNGELDKSDEGVESEQTESVSSKEVLESPRESSSQDTMGAPLDITPQAGLSEPHPSLTHGHPHVSHVPVTDPTSTQQEPMQHPGDMDMSQQPPYPEDDSFFSTVQQFSGQRAFTEIISSVQGDFNFLQDSEIDLESRSPHIDPAIVAAQPMSGSARPLPQQSGVVVTQQPSGSAQNAHVDLTGHSAQSLQELESSGVPVVFSQSTQPQGPTLGEQSPMGGSYPTQSYGQTLMSQPLQGSSQQSHTYSDHPQLSSHHGVDQSVISSGTPDAPPAIPMPGQTLQQNMESGQGKEKKPFAMNPNAAMFQSMYTNVQGQSGDSDGDMQQAGDMHQDGRGYGNMQNDYQGGFGNSYGRNSAGRGGPRGGRGGRGGGGAPNGYQRNNRGGGGGNGNQNGGGQYGGNRGNYNNNRGNSRGGMYQGYPPRSDYRPEGYQGVNGNGYSAPYNGGNKRGGNGGGSSGPRGNLRGGGMRGGPQRGGNSRGGSRGGFNNSRSYQQQQQGQAQQASMA